MHKRSIRTISDLVNSSHHDDFREIIGWMFKTGIGEKGAKDKLFNELSRCISKELSNGLVLVAIQQLEGETEIKAKYKRGEFGSGAFFISYLLS